MNLAVPALATAAATARSHVERETFYGQWTTEADACAELDRRVEESGLFRSYAEVNGYYLASRIHRQPRSARIDRILVPTDRLRSAGWNAAIGVEIKASGEKLGPALCQAIDYTYAAFDLRGTYVHPELIFLWPLPDQSGAVKSVMVQNGIGSLYDTYSESLVFMAEHGLIRVGRNGSVTLNQHVAARKVGSR